jgi:glycosyltransferase involved in cell wall biosynthesis
VFARPSLSEGLGSAFLEAMAGHVPVVASAVGGIPDIVHHEKTGLICDPHDPTSIADAIVRLMTDSALEAHIVGEASRFVQDYDWSRIVQRMSAIYESLSPKP